MATIFDELKNKPALSSAAPEATEQPLSVSPVPSPVTRQDQLAPQVSSLGQVDTRPPIAVTKTENDDGGSTTTYALNEQEPVRRGNIFDELKQRKPQPAVETPQAPKRTVLGTLGDVGVSLAHGVVDTGEAVKGLAGIATGGLTDKALDYVGYDAKTTHDVIDDLYSPAQQAANEKVAQAKGFTGKLEAMVENPSSIVHGVSRALPQLVGAGGIARGLASIAPKVIGATTAGRIAASAVGEGALTAGATAEGIQQETGDRTLAQTGMSLAAGAGTGLLTLLGGKIANRLGLPDVDSLLAGVSRKPGEKMTVGAISKALVGSGLTEGMLEEMPQSAQETVWMNLATGKPWNQGVPEASAEGGLIGAAMGLGGGGFHVTTSFMDSGKDLETDPLGGEVEKILTESLTDQPAVPAESPDIMAAADLSGVLTGTTIETDEDRGQRVNAALQFFNDPDVPQDAKDRLVSDGVFRFLGIPVPGQGVDASGPMQDEWEQQKAAAAEYNQAKARGEQPYSPELPHGIQAQYDEEKDLQGVDPGEVNDMMYDFADQAQDEQDQADVKVRRKGFARLQADEEMKRRQSAGETPLLPPGQGFELMGGGNAQSIVKKEDGSPYKNRYSIKKAITAQGNSPEDYDIEKFRDGFVAIPKSRSNSSPAETTLYGAGTGANSLGDVSNGNAIAEKLNGQVEIPSVNDGPPPGVNTPSLKSGLDGGGANSNDRADLSERAPLSAKTNGSIQRPGQKPESVNVDMLGLGDKGKIIDGVVEPIPVKMVDDLTPPKPSAKELLHNEPVLKPLPSDAIDSNTDKPIAGVVTREPSDVPSGTRSSDTHNKPLSKIDDTPTIPGNSSNGNISNTYSVGSSPEIIEYTTKKGKTIRGIVQTDLKWKEAKAIDPFTFKKDDGWFIREEHLPKEQTNDGGTTGAGENGSPGRGNEDRTGPVSGMGAAGNAPVSEEPRVPGGVAPTLTEDGRRKDGKTIMPGDVFTTATGRQTTPYPKYSTKRTTKRDTAKSNQWLIDNYRAEAEARGDDYNVTLSKAMKADKFYQADTDSAHMYLFGEEQPKVVPSILKDLTPKATPGATADPFSNNKVFTADAVAAARERLKAKRGTLSAGFDPELMQDLLVLGGAYFESGIRKFADWSKTVLADIGTEFRPFLRGTYENLRHWPGIDKDGMSSAAEVDAHLAEVSSDKSATPRTPSAKIARNVKEWLSSGKKIRTDNLFKWANEAYSGKQSEGKYTPKDAYDALELGINQYLADNFKFKSNEPVQQIKELEQILSLVPTQTKRTEEQDKFQQYSTPPPLAYVANWVVNLKRTDSYLEPSAGIGGLAVFGKIAGVGDIAVNELSDRRRDVLKEMGFTSVYSENAEQLDNILPAAVKPTVIVMNPPFSATGGRLSKNKTKFGAAHIEQALKRLEPGGRLVAIVGEGMGSDKPMFRQWWKVISAKYNVRANVGMNGEGYRKYGTTFDNQLLVIDKTSPTTNAVITGKVDNYADLISLLQGVRDDRTATAQRETNQPTGQEETPATETGAKQQQAVSPTTADMGTGQRGDANKPGSRRQDRPNAAVEAGGMDAGGNRPEPGRGDSGVDGGQQNNAQGVGLENTRQNGEPVPRTDTLETTRQEKQQQSADSVFEGYQPTVVIKGAKPHPADLVESAAMAAVNLPNITYQPSIPKETVTSGKLSEVQLEAITAAGQAHQDTLPNGETRGFFIGDGTGVGKGREIAGILFDNWNQGRKKSIWISKDRTLAKDANRDMDGIGWSGDLIIEQGAVKAGQAIPNRDGVLYTAYSTVSSAAKEGQLSRLQAIIDWAGPDFDGVVAFDESHKMGNAISIKEGRFTKKPSQMALSALDLQRALPKAKIVYVSATGATEVSNLAYAERLGLWGEGTPFANATAFIGKISQGGIAAMEVVARDMKAMGSYLARKLAYNGKNKAYQVKYRRLEHELSGQQREIYDELAGAWQLVLKNIDEALQITEADSNGKSHALSAFWGSHQRFFNQVLTAMQMPSVITSIKQDIKDGKAVVLQITNTNEASTNRALANAESLEDVDITPRDQLMQMIENSFPIQQYEEYEDEDGNKRTRPVVDSDGNPVVNREAVAMREELLDKLGSIKVPDAPLDQILNVFGVDKVAEVTGRSKRIVTVDDGSGPRKIRQGWSKTKGVADAAQFMADKKQILIFSEAGGTGASYHADNSAVNKRQRSHYILQAGWRADSAVQGLGRSHRSNQAVAPEYVLVTTDLKGHKRFISSIARKLSQLGALTEGQRTASSQGLFSERDNLESEYAVDAVQQLITNVYRGNVNGIDMSMLVRELGLPNLVDEHGGLNSTQIPTVPRFLNRILSMKIDMQNKVFDLFSTYLDANVTRAEENGTLDVGLETLKAKAIRVVDKQTVYTEQRSGAVTEYVQLDVDHRVEKVPFDSKRRMVVNNHSGMPWQIVSQSSSTNEAGNIVDHITLRNGRNAIRKVEKEGFEEKFTSITDKAEALERWNEALKAIPDIVTQREHLITGALLPIWDKLVGHPKIIRVQTGTETMLGRMIAGEHISEVMALLDVEGKAVEMTPKQAQDTILQNGQTLNLDNKWKIIRRRVAGENRMEVEGTGYGDYNILSNYGAFTERINYITRNFIPTGTDGNAVLERILKNHKILTVTGGRPAGGNQAQSDDNTQYSKSGESSGRTVAQVEEELRAKLGADVFESLQGTMAIVGNQEEARKIIAGLRGEKKYSAAWHGTPHTVDKFSSSKIGSGEGNQSYGYGLYFAGNKEVADFYRTTLSPKIGAFINEFKRLIPEAPHNLVVEIFKFKNESPAGMRSAVAVRKAGYAVADARGFIEENKEKLWDATDKAWGKPAGNLYKVDLAPTEDEYLLWDKPLSEQSKKVRTALDAGAWDNNAIIGKLLDTGLDFSGSGIYERISSSLGDVKDKGDRRNDQAASKYLHSLGIRGIKYLDASSRGVNFQLEWANGKDGSNDVKNDAESAMLMMVEDIPKAVTHLREKGKDVAADALERGDLVPRGPVHNYVIFNDADVSIVEVLYSADGKTIQGFTNGEKVWLVADGIQPGRDADVLNHEVGVHLRKLLLADREYQLVEGSLEKRQKETGRTGRAIRAAMARVPADTKPENYWSEVLAYMVEDAPAAGPVRRVMAAIKKIMLRVFGKRFVNFLSVDDFKAMAAKAVRATSSPAGKSEGVSFSFAGEKATAADRGKLATAKEMKADGQPREEIWAETGWWEIVPGQWSFEIDDSLSSIEPKEGKLSDALKHRQLFANYPFLNDYEISFRALGPNRRGLLDQATKTIFVNSRMSHAVQRSVIQHETQHIIQHHEGFATGTRYDASEPESYYRRVGEVEARLVQYRLNLPPAARKVRPPWLSMEKMLKTEGLLKEGQDVRDVLLKSKSSPDLTADSYQEARNTTILNATVDGVVSDASLTHGEKLVAEIMRKLAAVSSPAVAKNRFGAKKVDEALEAFRAARAAIKDPLKSAAAKQQFAANFVNKFPAEPRAELLNKLSQISRVKDQAIQQKRLRNFLIHGNKALAGYLKDEIIERLEKAVAPLRMKKDRVRRGRGAAFERDLKYLRGIAFKIGKTADSRVELQLEQDRLHQQHLILQDQLQQAKTPQEQERVEEQIADMESFGNLLAIFGGIEAQTFDEVVRAYRSMSDVLEEGRAPWREQFETWKERNKANREKAIKEITGEDEPVPETIAEKSQRVAREQSATGKVKEALSATANSIQSWELMLDKISRKSGGKTLQSWMVKHFGSIAHKATRDYERMQMETHERVMDKAVEIFGVKDNVALAKTFAKLGQQVEGKVHIAFGDKGERRAVTISPLQAAYWYQISRDMENPVVAETFEGMGIDGKTIDEIEKLIGPKLKAWADYLVADFYQDFHDDTNKVYRQVYGIDLDKTANYVPWRREVTGKAADKEKEGMLSGIETGSIKKGSLRSRVRNTKPFKMQNVNDILVNHIADMNHFKAWAIPTREINGTFNSPTVQKFIRQHYGRSTMRTIRFFQDRFVKSDREIVDDLHFLDRVRGNVTRAMVGLNPVVFLKQMTAIPAYMADVPVADWFKHTGYAMAHPITVARILGRSTMMKSRYKQGFERDVAAAMKMGGDNIIAQHRRGRDAVMVMVQLGDKFSVLTGGYAVYKYHLDKLKAGGMSHREADQQALDEFEKATERSQQSGAAKDLGWFQQGTPIMKLFTMFMTAPASYSRQIFMAVRNMRADPKDSAKRLFVFGVLLPVIFQAIADALMIIDGDDEDEERFLKNQAKGIALGPFQGLPIIRTIMEGYSQAITGQGYFGDEFTPVSEAFSTSKETVSDFFKFLQGGTERISPDEYLEQSLLGMVHTFGYFAGIPTKPIQRTFEGVYDAATGQTEYPIRRSIGYSKYVVGENK